MARASAEQAMEAKLVEISNVGLIPKPDMSVLFSDGRRPG